MHLNINLIKQFGLTVENVLALQIISQNASDDNVTDELVQHIRDFTPLGCTELVKAKRKSDSKFSRVRLNKRGKDILRKVQIPNVELADVEMANYLFKMYLNHEDDEREIGNADRVTQYCAILRHKLQMNIHEFYYFLVAAIGDIEYTKVLEKLFFDSNKNRYGKFENNIGDSKLFQWYELNKETVERTWLAKGLINN